MPSRSWQLKIQSQPRNQSEPHESITRNIDKCIERGENLLFLLYHSHIISHSVRDLSRTPQFFCPMKATVLFTSLRSVYVTADMSSVFGVPPPRLSGTLELTVKQAQANQPSSKLNESGI